MSHYIAWISANWDKCKAELPGQWEEWRDEVYQESQHPRLPSDIASLYAGLYMASQFALEMGVISDKEMDALRKTGWDIFVDMAVEQSGRVEEERPGERFIVVLKAMLDQGGAVLWNKDDEAPRPPIPTTVPIGWMEGDDYMLLNPPVAYKAVHEFCQRSGEPCQSIQQNLVL